MMLNKISMQSMADEMAKIAEMDPAKKEELKQFGKNTAAVLLGTGLGLGTAQLANLGLDRYFGSDAGKWAKRLSPGQSRALSYTIPTAIGTGYLLVSRKLEQKKQEELDKARARGEEMRNLGVQ